MKLFFKKFICFLFGHKLPKGYEQIPAIQALSNDINGYHYGIKMIACERCIGYIKLEKITHKEWEIISSKLIQEMIEQTEAARKPGDILH